MRHLLVFVRRLSGLFRKEQRECDLAEEIEANLELHIADNVRAGMTPAEARRDAMIKLGGVEPTKEAFRDQRSLPVLDNILQDLRASARRIDRRRWSFVHLVAILAVGFGCVIGMFDIAYGVLHTPLPCPDPDRVAVTEGETVQVLYAYDRPNPHLSAVFEKAAQYQLMDVNLDSGQTPKRIQIAVVSPQFFPALGIRISKGHDFSQSDSHPEPSSQPRWLPIILSHELWRTHFGASEAILNHSVEISLYPYRYDVIGIAGPNVVFPSGVDAWVPTHLISTSIIQTAGIPYGSGGVIGLLKPGLSLQAAEAAIGKWPSERYFDSGADHPIKLTSLRDFRAGEIYPLGLRLWLASIFFLILIVIAAATIFQTEAEVRRDEFAIRSALGASPGRLLASLSIETSLVVVSALAVSFLIRSILIQLTAGYLPLPKGFDASVRGLDLAMAAAAASIAFVASLFTQAAKVRGKTSGLLSYRLPVQIIPTTVVLIAAVLLVRSAYNSMHIDRGVQADGVFVAEVSFSADSERFAVSRIDPKMSQAEREKIFSTSSKLFAQQMNSEFSEIADTLTKRPGVVEAGAISTAPYKGYGPGKWQIQSSPTPDVLPNAATHVVSFRSMTPGAIPALGMKILHGQTFTGRATEDDNTLLVNEAMAEKLGRGPSALGQYIKFVSMPAKRIVGIVSNVREEGLFSEAVLTAYFPFSQHGLHDVDLVVRTSPQVSSRDARQLIETSVHATAPDAVVSHFERLSTMVESAGTLARYTAYYLLALAILSVFLAGFCASSKTLGEFHRRKREIGIRLALGATRRHIIGLFVYSDIVRSTVAALFGAILAWWFSRLLSHLLYGVKLLDPLSYVAGVAILIGSLAAVQILLLKKALLKNPRDLM